MCTDLLQPTPTASQHHDNYEYQVSIANIKFETLLQIALGAKNNSFLYGGCAPSQATFGSNADLIPDGTTEIPSYLSKRLKMLEAARGLIHTHDVQQKIQRALHRRAPGNRPKYE